MTLRLAEWRDKDGRLWRRGLPDGVPDTQAATGIPMGPPSLKDLGLPKELEVRLHNQLYARGLFSESDARRGIPEIQAALMAALRVDANHILTIYQGTGASKEEP